MKETMSILLLLITGITLFSGCSSTTTSDTQIDKQELKIINPNLNFSVASCDREIIENEEEYRGIINNSWINNNTIVISAFIHSTCGGCSLDGDYEIQGNNLTLKTNEKCGNTVTNCRCPKVITYEISNLEKKDYFIFFK